MSDTPAGWAAPSSEPTPHQPTSPYSPNSAEPGPTPPAGYAGPPAGWYGGPPPAPTPGVVPLRPLTVGELLDGAVKVVRKYPRPTLGISAGVAIVTTLLTVAMVLLFDTGTLQTIENEQKFRDAIPELIKFGSGLLLVAFAGQLAYQVLAGALAFVVGKAVLGQTTSLQEVWDALRPRLPAIVGVWLASSALVLAPIVVAGAAALALGGFGGGGLALAGLLKLGGVTAAAYLYVHLALAPAVLILEKAGVPTALRRSGVLVRRAWWRTAGLLLLTWIISQVAAIVLSLPFSLATGIGSFAGSGESTNTLLLILAQLGTGLATFVVAPFTAGVRALLYVDRRMRAEALDLTLQAAARP